MDSALPAQKRRSVLLVLCCTVFGAIAQVLIKSGAPRLSPQPSLVSTVLSIATNLPIVFGVVLYGLSTVLLVLALRHGDLSMVYPVIALTFVWVTILSVLIFGESMSAYKISGIAIIVAGVSILGVGGAPVNTPVVSVVWIFAAGFVGSFGAVLLKSGASRLAFNIRALLTNWRLAAGVAIYLLSFVFFVQGMRHGELSVLYPLVALGYLWTVLWAKLFFGEPLTWGKFAGLAMILVGISFLFLGNK